MGHSSPTPWRLAPTPTGVAVGRHCDSRSALGSGRKAVAPTPSRARSELCDCISLARQSMTVASCGAARMCRLLEAWVSEPAQAHGYFDGHRCFAGAERKLGGHVFFERLRDRQGSSVDESMVPALRVRLAIPTGANFAFCTCIDGHTMTAITQICFERTRCPSGPTVRTLPSCNTISTVAMRVTEAMKLQLEVRPRPLHELTHSCEIMPGVQADPYRPKGRSSDEGWQDRKDRRWRKRQQHR